MTDKTTDRASRKAPPKETMTSAQRSNYRVAEFHAELAEQNGDPEGITKVFAKFLNGACQ